MQYSAILLGFAAAAVAQSSTGTFTGPTLTPTAPAPAGCTANSNGQFELGITQIKSGMKAKRQSDGNVTDALTISLNNGVLFDQQGRIGYIAGNEQFQFDFNGQAGEKYTAGFSICANNTLALGGSAIWYECLSGKFYNIYDASWAPQCLPVYLDVIKMTASAAPSTVSGAASSSGSGTTITSAKPVTTSAAVVSSISDGQPQGGSTSAITSSSKIVTTVAPVPSSTTTTAAIITSISDHQIQGPTSTSTIVKPASVTPYSGNAAAMMTAAPGLLLAAAGAAAALL